MVDPDPPEDVEDVELDDEATPGEDADDSDAADDDAGEGESDGGAEDRGEDDAPGEGEGSEGRPSQVGPRGRPDSNARDARLRREAREQERIDRLVEQRLNERLNRQPAPDQAQQRRELEARRNAELETARLTGDPAEVTRIMLQHDREDRRAEMQARDAFHFENSDKQAFRQIVREDRIAPDVVAEVERRMGNLRAQGQSFIARELVLNVVLGEKLREGGKKARTQAERRGQRSRDRETVPAPRRAGSDVAPQRQRGGTDHQRLANRLRNVEI